MVYLLLSTIDWREAIINLHFFGLRHRPRHVNYNKRVVTCLISEKPNQKKSFN